jgi:hypothetical protein
MGRAAGLALIALLAAPASAHHGWSEYDSTRPLKLAGKILESGYEHPHGHIVLEVPGKKWNVVLAPPSRMEFRGLSKQMLAAGAQAAVEGYANRDRPDELRAERITIQGKTIELR